MKTAAAVVVVVVLLSIQHCTEGRSDHSQDVCHLPPGEAGMCYGYFPKWTFKNGQCEEFIYGGCGGNSNRFETKEECERACPPEDVCSLPIVPGPCEAYMPSWGYENGVCKRFIYGGCDGNPNRFRTKEECESSCAPEDVCSLPLVTGRCRAAIPRWGSVNGECKQFIYGGCGGNGNNFETKEECESSCAPEDVCSLPLMTGRCRAAIPRYGSVNGECKQFIYGGCGGNGNNFNSLADCQEACEETTERPHRCYYYGAGLTSRGCSYRNRRWVYDERRDSCVRRCVYGYPGPLAGYRTKRACEANCVA